MHTFDDRTPIFQQIAEQIRNAILSGELEEEGQVMSTTQYATTYRINPATAGKAMNILVEEGLIYKKRGVGMFVTAHAREQLRRLRRASFFEETFAPALVEANLLGIDDDELVAFIKENR